MMRVSYYAHVQENDTGGKEFQTVAQHLSGTAELCRAFAAAFGAVMTRRAMLPPIWPAKPRF